MKRRLFILFAIFFIFILCGCNSGNSSSVTSTVPSDSIPQESPSSMPESTHPGTGNVLLDATVKTSPGGDGQRAYIEVSKADAMSTDMDGYLDFLSQCVDGSDYNWWSILFEDGTGIVYVGSLPYAAEYGKIDPSDGSLIEVFGNITPEDDGTYIYTPVDDSVPTDSDSDDEFLPIGPVGGEGILTLDATIGVLRKTLDGEVSYDPEANTIISIVSADGLVQGFLSKYANDPTLAKEKWESTKSNYVSLDGSTRNMISTASDTEVDTMFVLIDNKQENGYILMIQNGELTYNLIDDFIELRESQ